MVGVVIFGEALIAVPLLALLMPSRSPPPPGGPRLDHGGQHRRGPGLAPRPGSQRRLADLRDCFRHSSGRPGVEDGG